MSQSTIENRLRAHYQSKAAECMVTSDADLDDLVVTTQPEATRWYPRHRVLLATAAAVVATVGVGLMITNGADPAPANVPPTLQGETQDQAARRIMTKCLVDHGMTVGSTAPDGGMPFTGPNHEATKKAAADCEAAVERAGLPAYTP